jgi:hypothetical protein
MHTGTAAMVSCGSQIGGPSIALHEASRDDRWKREDGHGSNSRTQEPDASGLTTASVHHDLEFRAQASAVVLVVMIARPDAGKAQPSRR